MHDMGVYFIAAGNATNNRQKTLDRAHSAGELAPLMPVQEAARLLDAFGPGEPVHAWGATERSLHQLNRAQGADHVVDVANQEVRSVFRFVFAYETPDERLQQHFGWEPQNPGVGQGLYPYVYFLRDRMPTERSDKRWFQHALAIESAHWLSGQKYIGDEQIEAAMQRTGSATLEAFLGIGPPSPRVPVEYGDRDLSGPVRVSDSAAASGATEPDAERPTYRLSTDSDSDAPKQGGQGRGLSAPERKAVELLAMEAARGHYEAEGYSVVDTSGSASYDLRCTRGERELHVEVKGTTGAGESVFLTRNEVHHARDHYPDVALFVVSGIELQGRGTEMPRAQGGSATVWDPWEVHEHSLTAETYRYRLSSDER